MATGLDRSALKRSIREFRIASDWRAVVILLTDLSLLAIATLITVTVDGAAWKVCSGALMGLQIARLFIIGHDACHQCFVSSRDWNRRIGVLAFLPSLTTYSLWESGHNLGHHVFTNLRGRDQVWTPLSKSEYDDLSAPQRALQRFYRSGMGFGAYYLVELWWKKLFFPNAVEVPGLRAVHRRDSVIVSVFAILWIAALAGAALATGQSVALVVATGFFWPLLVWCMLMGAVIYFHHTHPALRWYADPDAWERDRDGLSTTVHLTLPGRMGWLLNNIMTHPAHHLDVRVPFYRIEAAQRALAHAPVLVQPLTLAYMIDTTRRCKLYDYEGQRWMDFDGQYTSAQRSDGSPTHSQ